jgi:hypothetical protein
MVADGARLELTRGRFLGNVSDHSAGGSAIGVTDQAGPTTPQATGFVRDTYFHQDVGASEIFEASCTAATTSAITYDDNRFTTTGTVYRRNCHPAATTPSELNGLEGKAARNASGGTEFTAFLAAPTTISSRQSSTLAWAMTTLANRAISGVAVLGTLFGTTNVTPATTTKYDLLEGDSTLTSETVTVTCAVLGTPIAASPTNGHTRVAPEAPILAWYAASGASSYDVYLDTAEAPTTLVASGLTETTFSPGRGSVTVSDGRLIVTGRPKMRVMSPAPPQADGTFTVALEVLAGRQVRLLSGFADKSHYRELIIKNGRWKLRARDGRRRRTVGSARRPVTGVATVSIHTAGTAMSVTVDGEPLLAGETTGTSTGQFGVVAIKSTVALDDVRVVPGG